MYFSNWLSSCSIFLSSRWLEISEKFLTITSFRSLKKRNRFCFLYGYLQRRFIHIKAPNIHLSLLRQQHLIADDLDEVFNQIRLRAV